jgi:hypothetical protein
MASSRVNSRGINMLWILWTSAGSSTSSMILIRRMKRINRNNANVPGVARASNLRLKITGILAPNN